MRNRKKRSPLSTALQLFVAGVLLAVGAILLPTDDLSCSDYGYGQYCIHYIYKYNGLNAQTFKIILGVLAVLCIAVGLFFLTRHNKAQAERKSGAAFSASQPVLPQQPGMYPPPGIYPQPGAYPPPQNIYPQGGYIGNVQPQPPSNKTPQQ